MVDQITIVASDPRIVYNTPTSTGTNDSDTKAWELQAWSIDGRTGVFASTSAPNAFLSLQIQDPMIGFEYWGFLHNTTGSCFIRLTSLSSPTESIDEFADVPTEGNPGLPVMLFSTQLAEPAAPSIFLGNVDAPVMDLVSFVFMLPTSPVDGSFPTPTDPQESVFTPTNPINIPPAPDRPISSPSPAEVSLTTPRTFSITPSPQPVSFSDSLTVPTFPTAIVTSISPLTALTSLPTSTGLNRTNNALPDSTPSSHSSKSLAGKIAGGVVGGIGFLALLGWLAYYYRARRQRQDNQSKKEVETPDSRQSIISSEASNVITPFPAIPRPDFAPAKFGGREMASTPPLQPVRPVPYGVKPSQMRPASLPSREEGPSQPPMGVLPRAKHASLPRPPEASLTGPEASAAANVRADVNGSSSSAAHNVSRPMGPRRAVDGGPLALLAEPPRNEVITASPPTY